MEQNNCYEKPIMCCDRKDCGCVGYAYVPIQEMASVYDLGCAIKNGTIFPELDLDICEYGKVCKKWGGAL